MTRLIAFILKRPKISAIIVLSLVTTVGSYIGYNMLTISRLETRVAQLEKSVASKDNQITNLTASIDRQNAAVQRWQDEAAQRQALAESAARDAREARREADEAIGRLQASEAMTCQEGIDLIDKELWP